MGGIDPNGMGMSFWYEQYKLLQEEQERQERRKVNAFVQEIIRKHRQAQAGQSPTGVILEGELVEEPKQLTREESF